MTHRSALVLAALVASLASVSCTRHTGTVSLVNNAKEPISRAVLSTSWGETVEVADLDPSESTVVGYRVREAIIESK